jgi:hypothetical protein
MQRTFTLHTDPHEAVVGDTTLLLIPEVEGAAFAQAYADLRAMQDKVNNARGSKASGTKHAKADNVSPELLVELSATMRGFVRGFLLEESQPVFDGMRLPDRVLVELLEYTAELYGGGSGNPSGHGGSSSDS